MSKKVKISCDSTVDLPIELIEKYQLTINPMPVVIDGKTLRDGVDAKPADLFAYTKSTGKLATTSAPNTEDFAQLFSQLTADGSEVVHFPIGSGFSGSFNFARLAALSSGVRLALGAVFAVCATRHVDAISAKVKNITVFLFIFRFLLLSLLVHSGLILTVAQNVALCDGTVFQRRNTP